jgi:hypothetical protein
MKCQRQYLHLAKWCLKFSSHRYHVSKCRKKGKSRDILGYLLSKCWDVNITYPLNIFVGVSQYTGMID